MFFGLFKKKKDFAVEEGIFLGEVTHYFSKSKACVIKLTDSLSVGDMIYIKGHTTDFKEKVNSIQIDNEPIQNAKKGQSVGLAMKNRVRLKDKVYRLA